MEEKSRVGFRQHGGVIKGVSSRDNPIAQRFESRDAFALLIRLTKVVVHYPTLIDLQPMAQQGWPAELSHEGLSKFLEGIGEDDDLSQFAQLGKKLHSSGQRVEGADHFLDIREPEPVLIENLQTSPHQDIVVWDIARGQPKFGDRGFISDCDPDLGNQHTFQVESDDALFQVLNLPS